jgi:23S rRNA (pseudouridine1915-N3)-methyltransferase
MRIRFIQTGKTREEYVKVGVENFRKRLVRYVPFETETIPDLKNSRNLTMKEVMEKEAQLILRRIREGDHVVLLDERGDEHSSIGFAEYLNSLESRVKQLVFVCGGPYGFSEDAYRRADSRLSLSQLTFSHQLVRLIFMEQLYRAFTIIKGDPYHHA